MIVKKPIDAVEVCNVEIKFESGKKAYIEGRGEVEGFFDVTIYENPSDKEAGILITEDMRQGLKEAFSALLHLSTFVPDRVNDLGPQTEIEKAVHEIHLQGVAEAEKKREEE